MIVYIKHIDVEGPGTLGDFFRRKEVNAITIDLARGDRLPDDLSNIDAVISLGGPMNVYEEEKHPFLKAENEFLKEVISKNIPFLGICLGSQLLAKASQSKVGKSPRKEIGFSTVQLTKEGEKDPLFKGLKNPVKVFQWHEDMFFVPSDGALLAMSDKCPNQAFRLGECAYGLQFHVEITDVSIKEWTDEYIRSKEINKDMKEEMLRDFNDCKEEFFKVADIIYGNFFKIVERKKAAV